LLVAVPKEHDEDLPLRSRPPLSPQLLAACLSAPIREHVLSGGVSSEHRPVTIAFLRFEGTDALIGERGADAAADALNAVLVAVGSACDQHGVAFLASDVERWRQAHHHRRCAKRHGQRRGTRAAGGTRDHCEPAAHPGSDRRASRRRSPATLGLATGAVHGDGNAVNLAARVMAKAEPGTIYATADVLERSNTLFETRALEPFSVRARPSRYRRGPWATRRVEDARFRCKVAADWSQHTELGAIRKAFTSALRRGR
jgi:class 3 adenylate cyclase